MPHGGPELRDFLSFDAPAQAFAAQGWLVVQPNFRGSGGYGKAFAESGHRQWAARMKDDVTDAVRHSSTRASSIARASQSTAQATGVMQRSQAQWSRPDLYRAVVSQPASPI